MLRKTRFVCVSDTHNASPATGAFKLPKGDVLIHAGDLTKQGTLGELQKAVDWIEKADFEVKIVVAGNHDITLDKEFYAQQQNNFHNQNPQSHEECIRLLKNSPSITYLDHETVDIKLRNTDGPRTKFRVFGSPFSIKRRTWAFQYDLEAAAPLWDCIPLNSDIVVTHGPPKYHCDEWDGREGCEVLRQTLWRVRPRLAVCGHIHNARGVERIQWDLSNPNIRFKETRADYWEDPTRGTKKQVLLDLTPNGPEPLRNDGSHRNSDDIQMSGAEEPAASDDEMSTVERVPYNPSSSTQRAFPSGRGFEDTWLSGRCDLEALEGRLGRQETCVVNACIMAGSYPYQGSGGERYNKPIVVDLELPTWEI